MRNDVCTPLPLPSQYQLQFRLLCYEDCNRFRVAKPDLRAVRPMSITVSIATEVLEQTGGLVKVFVTYAYGPKVAPQRARPPNVT